MGNKASAEQQLFRLLQDMFQPSELRRFLRHRADYDLLYDALPGAEASFNTLADAAIQALDRYGLITQRLFDELLKERPHRRADIQRVAASWGVRAADEEVAAREYRVEDSTGLSSLVVASEGPIEGTHKPLSPDLHGNGRFSTAAAVEFRGHPIGKQVTSASSGPLRFSSISIDASDPNWSENTERKEHSPFISPCSQRFEVGPTVWGADPSFDITILNTARTPTIFTKIGIQVRAICSITYICGHPQAAKILKSDSYILHIPDHSFDRHELHDGRPQDVWEMIIEKLPDPIYLESNAPYRYGLLLKDYWRNIPNWARIRMWVASDQGETWSGELEMAPRLTFRARENRPEPAGPK